MTVVLREVRRLSLTSSLQLTIDIRKARYALQARNVDEVSEFHSKKASFSFSYSRSLNRKAHLLKGDIK